MSSRRTKVYKKIHHNFRNIDEFDVLGDIGKGGYSVVKLVKHKKSGKKYALKCAMKIRKNKDRTRKTRKEVEILYKLHHTNIIHLRGWFEDAEYVYMVLEYLQGRDLGKYFRKDLPKKSVTKSIIKQVVKALLYCHKKNILHRDIKLENILINKENEIKLTDFGLCTVKKYTDEYYTDVVGTARYIAPEILNDEGYDENIDVWGIGIVLFMLLTGEYPFDGKKRESIFHRIKHKEIKYSHYNLTNNEVKLLKRLLCKDQRYRISLEDITKHAWFGSN